MKGVVGIDPGLTNCGFARIEEGEEAVRLNISPKNKRASRLDRMKEVVLTILRNSHADDLFFMEDYAYGVRGKVSSLATMGELGGIIKISLYRRSQWQREPLPISPGQWKKFLSDDGRLNKDAFKLKVFQKYKIECSTNDEAAAYAMAMLGYYSTVDQKGLLKYEEKVVNAVQAKYWEEIRKFTETP